MVEYYYPYPKVGIVHLSGQKMIRFDPAATVDVQDLEGGIHQLSLRYGHFQRTAIKTRAISGAGGGTISNRRA